MSAMLLAAALGAVVGLLLALTGAGGGILAVPLLVFGLHLGVARAAPIDRARLYSAEAIALADLNKLKEADAAADLALAEWARATPRGSNEQGEATMTKATIAFARGDLATAKRIGVEAVAIHAKVAGPATAARIGTLSNMSTITLQARELVEGLLVLEEQRLAQRMVEILRVGQQLLDQQVQLAFAVHGITRRRAV